MAGTGITIGIDESSPFGVVVAGLEVIQAGVYGTLLASGPFLALSGRQFPAAQICGLSSAFRLGFPLATYHPDVFLAARDVTGIVIDLLPGSDGSKDV